MWSFWSKKEEEKKSNKKDEKEQDPTDEEEEDDEESVYTEVEYEEDYEYEVEVTDDEAEEENSKDEEGSCVMVEHGDVASPTSSSAAVKEIQESTEKTQTESKETEIKVVNESIKVQMNAESTAEATTTRTRMESKRQDDEEEKEKPLDVALDDSNKTQTSMKTVAPGEFFAAASDVQTTQIDNLAPDEQKESENQKGETEEELHSSDVIQYDEPKNIKNDDDNDVIEDENTKFYEQDSHDENSYDEGSYGVTDEEGDDDDDEGTYDDDEEIQDEEEAVEQADEEQDDEEDDGVTTLAEKQSLLSLAAEHDRVDILKSILAENDQDQETLLHTGLPPLHIAVAYGSTNATSCLLRMGANPAIRPTAKEIKAAAAAAGDASASTHTARYIALSAWELAFGKRDQQDHSFETSSFWGSKKKSTAVDMAPSKREGIRHAFTAEALRCIGADEKERLEQLIDSGMPIDIDIGGKTLATWCLDMEATRCRQLVAPEQDQQKEETTTATHVAKNETKQDNQSQNATTTSSQETCEDTGEHAKEKVLEVSTQRQDQIAIDSTYEEDEEEKAKIAPNAIPEPASPSVVRKLSELDDVTQLQTRLEELDNLAAALSTCLDNLAEDVSVCHGLLLMGGGASALASHVRSLKDRKARAEISVQDWRIKWQNAEQDLLDMGGTAETQIPQTTLSRRVSVPNNVVQLRAQVAVSEQKILKLRASITDMSEESDVALKEVERKGLTGGIQLVRGLREELRELDFQLSEAKSGEAMCRAKTQKMRESQKEMLDTPHPERTFWKEDETAQVGHATIPSPPLKARNNEGESSPILSQPLKSNLPEPSSIHEQQQKEQEQQPSIPEPESLLPPELPNLSPGPKPKSPPGDLSSQEKEKVTTASQQQQQSHSALHVDTAAVTGDALKPSQRIQQGKSDALVRYQADGQVYDIWHLILRMLGLGTVAVKQNMKSLKESTVANVMIV